ncbi:MAG: hypothetical protein WAZ63_12875, partial [Rhodoferax sp.]|uniref:hypothetical protein n=1 Tax=Rhodoferax sp. TaxID=50421 RepID=UPI003BB585B8
AFGTAIWIQDGVDIGIAAVAGDGITVAAAGTQTQCQQESKKSDGFHCMCFHNSPFSKNLL